MILYVVISNFALLSCNISIVKTKLCNFNRYIASALRSKEYLIQTLQNVHAELHNPIIL